MFFYQMSEPFSGLNTSRLQQMGERVVLGVMRSAEVEFSQYDLSIDWVLAAESHPVASRVPEIETERRSFVILHKQVQD
jgi:hypothetical protein